MATKRPDWFRRVTRPVLLPVPPDPDKELIARGLEIIDREVTRLQRLAASYRETDAAKAKR